MADVLSCLPETESYDGENMCCSFLRCNGYEDTFAVGCEAGNARDGHVGCPLHFRKKASLTNIAFNSYRFGSFK
jgi:hypothetical protein